MSMSKKDFIALADELRDENLPLGTVDALVRFCRRQNPAFKEGRWRDYLAGKCGPSGGEIKKVKTWPGGGPVLAGDR